jgi:aspartate 4-decarboxylase
VDLEFWLLKVVGEDVLKFIKENYHPLDVVYRLAADHSIVLLNGSGFAAPDWSVRISFANLQDDVYDDIGRAVRAVARSYVEAYHFSTQNGAGKGKATVGGSGGKGERSSHR